MFHDAKSDESKSTRRLIERVLAQPTAPFREHFIRRELEEILVENQIPHFRDRAGNLIAGVRNWKALKSHFRICLFAHTDHPGFHLGSKIKGRKWSAHWFGGTAPQLFGARVRVFHATDSNRSFAGHVAKLVDTDFYKDGFEFQIQFDAHTDMKEVESLPSESFGTFDFPGYRFDGDYLHSRAADDLVGCVMAIGAMIDQENQIRASKDSSQKKRRTLVSVFTRAEEVGFVGCVDLLLNSKLPKSLHVISLEASRTFPEAEIGKGPVLRIGDRRTLCHSGFSNEIWKVAQELENQTKLETSPKKTRAVSAKSGRVSKRAKLDLGPKTSAPFEFQRRLMSGGMCELTALAAFDHIATALAVPLGNYHNWPGPSPEMVSLRDVDNGRRLLAALGAKMHKPVDWQGQTKKDVMSYHRKLKKHLKVDLA